MISMDHLLLLHNRILIQVASLQQVKMENDMQAKVAIACQPEKEDTVVRTSNSELETCTIQLDSPQKRKGFRMNSFEKVSLVMGVEP